MKQNIRPTLLVAATVVAAASLLSFASPAHAQMPSNSGGSMSGLQFSGGPAIKGGPEYVRRFVFFNLDGASVRRYKAKGYTDEIIQGVGNLAIQTGLPMDYFFRRLGSGVSLTDLAVQHSVPRNNLAYRLMDTIPGYGMDVVPAAKMP